MKWAGLIVSLSTLALIIIILFFFDKPGCKFHYVQKDGKLVKECLK